MEDPEKEVSFRFTEIGLMHAVMHCYASHIQARLELAFFGASLHGGLREYSRTWTWQDNPTSLSTTCD